MDFRRLLANPALVVGAFRALAIMSVGFGFTFFEDNQRVEDAVLALSAVMTVLSLLFTGASARATDAKIEAARAELPPGASYNIDPPV